MGCSGRHRRPEPRHLGQVNPNPSRDIGSHSHLRAPSKSFITIADFLRLRRARDARRGRDTDSRWKFREGAGSGMEPVRDSETGGARTGRERRVRLGHLAPPPRSVPSGHAASGSHPRWRWRGRPHPSLRAGTERTRRGIRPASLEPRTDIGTATARDPNARTPERWSAHGRKVPSVSELASGLARRL